MSQTKKLVIIGLGGTASNVARPAKRLDPPLDITILPKVLSAAGTFARGRR